MSRLIEAIPRLSIAAGLTFGLTACAGNPETEETTPTAIETLSPEKQRSVDAGREEAARFYADLAQKQRNELAQRLHEGLTDINEREVAERALAIIVTDFCDGSVNGTYARGQHPVAHAEAYEQYYPIYAETRLLGPDGAEWPDSFIQATSQACSIPYSPEQLDNYGSAG